jgi:hypothetical protein
MYIYIKNQIFKNFCQVVYTSADNIGKKEKENHLKSLSLLIPHTGYNYSLHFGIYLSSHLIYISLHLCIFYYKLKDFKKKKQQQHSIVCSFVVVVF